MILNDKNPPKYKLFPVEKLKKQIKERGNVIMPIGKCRIYREILEYIEALEQGKEEDVIKFR